MYGEKAWRQKHKNAASNIEQVKEAAPTKQQLYGHLPSITKTKFDELNMGDTAGEVRTNS